VMLYGILILYSYIVELKNQPTCVPNDISYKVKSGTLDAGPSRAKSSNDENFDYRVNNFRMSSTNNADRDSWNDSSSSAIYTSLKRYPSRVETVIL
ncbi:hypothetical protein U1Q18_051056, partial [Sarracenia purpurea var. burkii]